MSSRALARRCILVALALCRPARAFLRARPIQHALDKLGKTVLMGSRLPVGIELLDRPAPPLPVVREILKKSAGSIDVQVMPVQSADEARSLGLKSVLLVGTQAADSAYADILRRYRKSGINPAFLQLVLPEPTSNQSSRRSLKSGRIPVLAQVPVRPLDRSLWTVSDVDLDKGGRASLRNWLDIQVQDAAWENGDGLGYAEEEGEDDELFDAKAGALLQSVVGLAAIMTICTMISQGGSVGESLAALGRELREGLGLAADPGQAWM